MCATACASPTVPVAINTWKSVSPSRFSTLPRILLCHFNSLWNVNALRFALSTIKHETGLPGNKQYFLCEFQLSLNNLQTTLRVLLISLYTCFQVYHCHDGLVSKGYSKTCVNCHLYYAATYFKGPYVWFQNLFHFNHKVTCIKQASFCLQRSFYACPWLAAWDRLDCISFLTTSCK